MTDCELLEKAAKAAGYNWRGFSNGGHALLNEDIKTAEPRIPYPCVWNPLEDYEYAFMLMTKLRMEVACCDGVIVVSYPVGESRDLESLYQDVGIDHDKSTARAIVRAAAAIGESL